MYQVNTLTITCLQTMDEQKDLVSYYDGLLNSMEWSMEAI